ncbi:MAG TPA: DUF4238 domain-containing protein [Pyrinomonadaceae bacterium]|jgi:hypothetical protein
MDRPHYRYPRRPWQQRAGSDEQRHGRGSDFVAKLLKKTEDDAAPIIKRLVSASTFSLTQEEYKAVAFFIAYLAQRNPYSRTKIGNLYTEIHKTQLKAQAEDPIVFQNYAKSCGYEADQESIETLRHKILNFDEHFEISPSGAPADDLFFLMTVLFAQTAAPMLLNKHWVLLNVHSTRSLVASDNPVAILPPENHPPQMGYGVENGLIYLPISPKRALLLMNRKAPKSMTDITRASVIECNQWMALNAHKSIFSDSYSQENQDALDKAKEGDNLKIRIS